MKLSWINILLTLSVVTTLTAGIITVINYKKYSVKTQRINDANNLLLQTFELRSLIKDAETGQRGYLLTGKIEYLKPYQDFDKKIEPQKERILNLLIKNELFRNDVHQLLRLITAKREELRQTIIAKDSEDIETSLKIVNSDLGNKLMDSIRTEVNLILFKEQKLLSELNMEYQEFITNSNTFNYFVQFFVICTTILAFILLERRQKLNNNLIFQLNASNENLEEKVVERTRNLHDVNQELCAQNEEIQSQTEQIIYQNNQLTQLNIEKNKFMGIASHDLKSPINNITGLISIIQMSPNATVASQSEYIEMINKASKGMLKLLKDLLDINKIDQGKHEINLTKVNLNWIMTNISFIFREQAASKNITINFTSSGDKIEINADEGMLMQIMENLISNAIKFTKGGKSIFISILNLDEKTRIEVRDQGLGIAKNEMHLLFGKFQKLSARPTAGEDSSGLGLSIVKELVEALKGKIWCESILGEGSVFIIEFYR